MAQAKRTMTEVTRTVKVTENVPTITLVLTLDEAQTLWYISQKIGGDPVYSRRAHMDAIDSALEDARAHVGVDDDEDGSDGFAVDQPNRAIYFKHTATKFSAT